MAELMTFPNDWSKARIAAYKEKNTNPNAYYYRFNEMNEDARNGDWDEEEEFLFIKRLFELGANCEWGIFSRAIPGRVGYQCSNFWRKLITDGKIEDPNYYYDNRGQLRHSHGLSQMAKISNDPSLLLLVKHGKKYGKKYERQFKRFGFTLLKDYPGLPKQHPKNPWKQLAIFLDSNKPQPA